MQYGINIQGPEFGFSPGLSARERNKLKRDLKRKGSSMLQSQASLSQAKRGKTSADAPGQVTAASAMKVSDLISCSEGWLARTLWMTLAESM